MVLYSALPSNPDFFFLGLSLWRRKIWHCHTLQRLEQLLQQNTSTPLIFWSTVQLEKSIINPFALLYFS